MLKSTTFKEQALLSSADTKDWHAWNDEMPPAPNDFHVIGDVLVPNPGVTASLHPRSPQGINSTILLLNLVLIQRTGMWPQMMTWTQARYDKVVLGSPYKTVQIYLDDVAIAEMPVTEVV